MAGTWEAGGLGAWGATLGPPCIYPLPRPDRSHPEAWLGPSLRDSLGIAAFLLVPPTQLSPLLASPVPLGQPCLPLPTEASGGEWAGVWVP